MVVAKYFGLLTNSIYTVDKTATRWLNVCSFLLQNVKGLTGAGAFEHLLVFQNQRLALNMDREKIGYIKIKRGFYKN